MAFNTSPTGTAGGDTGASATDGSGVRSSNVDPLIALGLVDPKSVDAEPGSAGQQQQQDPNTDPNQDPNQDPNKGKTGAQTDWDSDDNPYKQRAADLERGRSVTPNDGWGENPQQTLQTRLSTLDAEANAALANLMATEVAQQRMTPQVAQAVVQSARDAHAAQMREQATIAQATRDRQTLLPAAKMMTAQKLAKEMSTATVKIKPEDLQDAPTVDAMRERASMMVKQARDTTFNQRRDGKVDRVEGGTHAGAVDREAIDNLPPFYKIKMGLARGQ